MLDVTIRKIYHGRFPTGIGYGHSSTYVPIATWYGEFETLENIIGDRHRIPAACRANQHHIAYQASSEISIGELANSSIGTSNPSLIFTRTMESAEVVPKR